jgi:NAD(P)-dependent dehydrogenase (short-subunit alcohol dehydrogenase family)
MSKVWLITGSSRGLGRALAAAAAAAGHRVVATARTPAALDDLVARHPRTVAAVPLDVTDEDAAGAAVTAAVERFGRLDVVVNNAGYATLGSIEETPADAFRAQIETNLLGLVNVTRAALPVLRRQRSGHFVQISTIGGRRAGGPGLAAYSAAKHGVEGFSEALCLEVAPFGVKVTIIEPGGFATDWAGSSMEVVEPGEDYRPSVGRMIGLLRGDGGHAPGDPVKAAKVVLDVAAMDRPPLRLPLGNDAVELIRAADQAKLAELDQWEAVSRGTDRDDAVPMDLSMLRR